MSPETNVLGSDVGAVISSVLRPDSGAAYVVDPTPDMIESLVEIGVDGDSLPPVRVLAESVVLKTVLDDFLVASNAADLVETGALDVRVAESLEENALLVTDSSVVAVVTAGDRVAGLGTDDESFVGTANDVFGTQFEAADPFTIRTPPLSAVRSSLEAELGEAVRADFDSVLASVSSVDGEFDEVVLSLLVGARNELLLYDVSKWGEDTGIASKATFSRTKTQLEEQGLIETEKVPIDVGRPRLRLQLGDERLREDDAATFASAAREMLG